MQKNQKKAGLKSKSPQVDRSRSRSRSPSPQRSKGKINPKQSKKNVPRSSRDKLKGKPLNKSLVKSQSKRSLKKSQSDKNLKRSLSQSRLNSASKKPLEKKQPPSKQTKPPVKQKLKSKEEKSFTVQENPSNAVKSEERDMGIIFIKPQHDKIIFRGLEITDPVFDKYLEMINNDNDASYVMNALPELRNFKKEDESEGRDFVSGRISRLSGIFENLSVDKIITPIKKVPNYYSGQCGKNLIYVRIVLQTKFKVEVDLGFLQYSLDGDKLTIFRIYISKIYRRMNYVGYAYLQAFRFLSQKHPGADRWSIFILQRNVSVHKFFKFLGFHIQKIATESKNKTLDYFQEFTIRKKELVTILSSMTK